MKSKLLGLVAGIALSALPLQAASANSITLTAFGSSSDGALAAEADFTTAAGLLTVTLKNLLSPTTSNLNAGQTISDLSFTLSNNAGTLGSPTASGELANVGSTGTVSAPVSDDPARWLGQGPPPPGGSGTPIKVNGATVTLEVLGGGQPSELILPQATSFPNANASIKGGQFNPFLIGPVTFTLPLSGVTASTTVDLATFSFGTGPDHFITVPGPIVGAGLPGIVFVCALLALARRRLPQSAIAEQSVRLSGHVPR